MRGDGEGEEENEKPERTNMTACNRRYGFIDFLSQISMHDYQNCTLSSLHPLPLQNPPSNRLVSLLTLSLIHLLAHHCHAAH